VDLFQGKDIDGKKTQPHAKGAILPFNVYLVRYTRCAVAGFSFTSKNSVEKEARGRGAATNACNAP
jgi:hypothetical protein